MSIQTFKYHSRQLLAVFLYKLRVLSCITNLKYRKSAVVLMYHRVMDHKDIVKNVSQSGLVVSKETFRIHMEYLKRNFKILSLSEFIDKRINNVPFSKKSVLITFDDGWKDNFTNAYPVLKALEIPAAIFLTAGFIGKNKDFWQTRLIYLVNTLHKRSNNDKLLQNRLLGLPHTEELLSLLESTNEENRQQRLSSLLAKLKKYKIATIEQFIEKLCGCCEISPDSLDEKTNFLDWHEVYQMQQNGIEFGSHSVTHEILTRNKHLSLQEIKLSKSIIENNMGVKIFSFSYPNGDYDNSIINAVRNEGYKVAFSTRRGQVTHRNDKMAIPRINIHEDMTNTIPMLLCRIVGFW